MLLKTLLEFIKHPTYEIDENRDLKYRVSVFLKLLGISLALSIVLATLIGSLQSFFGLDFGEHAIEALFENYSVLIIAVAAVILAPLLEELIFRAPLAIFKNSRYFNLFFYIFTLAFGFYHLLNFEITNTVLLFSPLLVAPQISVGALLGFIRVRFGLLWAMALHACYNLVLVGPVLLLKLLDLIPE
ncbi:MAG: CPBP family intramembrane glutamic endopeptidase [Flavobacteriaceae bacterium]